ncbi:MAG: radical SAM family heme chaperone HemW [Acidimicrobiales bacterium]
MSCELSAGLGVYVHVPFCAKRCDYCAFATWTDRHHLAASYVDACITQLAREQQDGGLAASSLYLGGGTPSQLSTADLRRLLGSVEKAPGAEVTVEANPQDVTPTWAEACADSGVTRVSLGVQSFDPAVLAGLGRDQSPATVRSAVLALSSAGIEHYSVDLIYGGKGETDESWAGTLGEVLALDPSPVHVSAYALTIEAGTPLSSDTSRHPDDDAQALRYEMADNALSRAGMSWYEISNWASPGHEARHNLNYWRQGDYLAIGCAAHGHRAGTRWWNLRTPERYIGAINAGLSPVAVSETLSLPERVLEELELSLRTSEGVPAAALESALRNEPDDGSIADLVEKAAGDRLVLTLKGRLLANEVACRLRPPTASKTLAQDHLKGEETPLHCVHA